MEPLQIGSSGWFREQSLDLLWRQWTVLGVAGHGAEWGGAPVDPEALLLATCTMARYDARLFDAVLEWMGINGRYINVQRLRRLITGESFAAEPVFRAVAALTRDSTSASKWRRSVAMPNGDGEPVPLFFLKDGRPMPLVGDPDATFMEHGFLRDRFEPRHIAGAFRPEPLANLLLRLRALLGVNARCEILAFLSINGRGSPRAIARDTCYTPAAVIKALEEMRDSGYVTSRTEGRHRYHRLGSDAWRELLLGQDRPKQDRPVWIVWPRLLRALEEVWIFLLDTGLDQRPLLAQASRLRRLLLSSTMEKLDTSIPDFVFGDISAHPGEALIPFFCSRVAAMFDYLRRLADK